MALLLLAGAGYAAYEAHQRRQNLELPGVDPCLNLDDATKTSVELLPHETAAGVFSTSTTTITFYKGDYRRARDFLETRVQEILELNPWLGGWLVPRPQKEDDMVDKSGGGGSTFKLWYDPTGREVPPNIFTCMEPGDIPLKRSTKYGQYNDICADFSVKVPMIDKLIGQNHPFFKVTIIPDSVQLYERFAVVVSLSHAVGDGYTYYQIYRMLMTTRSTSTGGTDEDGSTSLRQLNACRKRDYQASVVKYLGSDEATYLRKANDDMMEDIIAKFNNLLSNFQDNKKTKKTGAGEKETLLFTVDMDWLQQKIDDENERINQEGSTESTPLVTASPSEIVLSWWFNISQAEVAFVPKQLRDNLDILSPLDAGNYNTPIPLTKIDYATPQLIHDAIATGKRCGTYDDVGGISPLPARCDIKSFGVDWTDLYSSSLSSGPHIDEELGLEFDLHIPLFTMTDLQALPDKLSVMVLFEAKKATSTSAKRLGVLISAPKGICDRISSCGIIDEDMTTSPTLDMVNRRGSVIDFQLPEGTTIAESLGLVIRSEEVDEDFRAEGLGDDGK